MRLLTLTGPGGVGKTRLALEVARTLSEHFPDGVWFVSLAPLRDPGLVASTVTQALGINERGHLSAEDALRHHLRHRALLLVLDNFEHVKEARLFVAGLLAAGAHVKVLVTSREPRFTRRPGRHRLQPAGVVRRGSALPGEL